MPWKETTPVAEGMPFLVDYRSGLFTMSFQAGRHGVSRKMLYRWIEGFEMEGVAGLEDQMRRPRWHPNQTSEEVEADLSSPPQPMQQHRQLSCNGHDGSFLRVPFASDRQCLAESSQVAVLSERPQDVLRRLDQKAAQEAVTLFRDAQLRVGIPALALRRHQSEVRPHGPALSEAARMLQRQDIDQRHDRAHSSHLSEQDRLGVLFLPEVPDPPVQCQDLCRDDLDRRQDTRQRLVHFRRDLVHRLVRELSLIHISEPTRL